MAVTAATGIAATPYRGSGDLTVSNNMTFSGTLAVTGAVTLASDLTVQGNFTFGNAVTDNLIVNGRIATSSAAGAALEITSSYVYGEGIEMRYQVTNWTGAGSSFKGMYLRAEAITNTATGKSLYGTEIYGVLNNVTMGTGSLWGTLTYAYVKGVDAVTVNNMYAGQFELTWDASRTGDCTITTEAAVILAKVTGGRVADYTKIHGIIIRFGEMDGDTQTFGSGIHIEDDADMSGTSTFTKGLQLEAGCGIGVSIEGSCTDGIKISGATTDAIEISGDATNAINISSGCSPTTGLLIAGNCTNAINITGTANAFGILYDVNMTTQIAANVEGIKIILERDADVVVGTSNVLGAEIIVKQGSDSFANAMSPQITGLRIAIGEDNTKATVYGLKVETQSSGYVDYLTLISLNNGTSVEATGALLYVRSYENVGADMVRIEQREQTAAKGVYITDATGTGTITDVFSIDCRNSTNLFNFSTVGGSLSADATGETWTHRIAVDCGGAGTRYIKLSSA